MKPTQASAADDTQATADNQTNGGKNARTTKTASGNAKTPSPSASPAHREPPRRRPPDAGSTDAAAQPQSQQIIAGRLRYP